MDRNTAICIKNTFLEVNYQAGGESPSDELEHVEHRRSPSTPASWRPGKHVSLDSVGSKQVDGWLSDDSATTASRTNSSRSVKDQGPTDVWPDTDDDEEKFTGSMVMPPVLAWQPTIPPAEALVPASGATRLNRQAPVFTPAVALAPPEAPQRRDVAAVLDAVKAAFMALPDAANFQVCQEPRSGISVRAAFHCLQTAERSHRARDVVKRALLDGASCCQNTCVLGYGANPFKDDGWDMNLSFVVTLSYLPPSRADSACWDTYAKGFCPRRTLCRWSHPVDSETTRIRVSFGVSDLKQEFPAAQALAEA